MKKTHEELRAMIPLYIDHELDEEETALLESHLKECAECREEAELYRELADELHIEDIPVPEGFHEELHKKLSKKQKRAWWSYYPQLGTVTALFAIVLLSVFFIKGPSNSDISIMQDTMTTLDVQENQVLSDGDDEETSSASDDESQARTFSTQMTQVPNSDTSSSTVTQEDSGQKENQENNQSESSHQTLEENKGVKANNNSTMILEDQSQKNHEDFFSDASNVWLLISGLVGVIIILYFIYRYRKIRKNSKD